MIAFTTLLVFFGLLRIVNSPFGRVLQAIRENEFRAEALGYRVVAYRTAASVLSAAAATVAGAMLGALVALQWPRYLAFVLDHDRRPADGRDRWNGNSLRLVAGSNASRPRPDLSAGAHGQGQRGVSGVPILPNILHPDRWLLWLGVFSSSASISFPRESLAVYATRVAPDGALGRAGL